MAEQVDHLLNIPATINHYIDGNLDAREAVVDVLTETMHFAGTHGVEFEDAVALAYMNYTAELEGES